MNNNFDFERIWESKRALRQRLATAPIRDKLRMLDVLRERAVAIRGVRFREATTVQERPGRYGDRKESRLDLRKGAWLQRSFTPSTP